MSTNSTLRNGSLLSLVLAGVLAGTTAAEAGSVRCEIHATSRSGGVVLEGVVYAKSNVEGSYTFSVSKSGGGGSSDINQSGDFSASPGSPGALGTVNLGGGGSYRARLEVRTDDGSASCSERG